MAKTKAPSEPVLKFKLSVAWYSGAEKSFRHTVVAKVGFAFSASGALPRFELNLELSLRSSFQIEL
jgi:hypothetical protein